MVIGYSLSFPDNDSYLNEDLYEKNICECLEFVKHREKYLNEHFKIRRRSLDVSTTYDRAEIVSEKFKSFCDKINLKGISFFNLQNQKSHYLMIVNNILEYDNEPNRLTSIEYNDECQEFNEVVGAYPIKLKSQKILNKGIYRTDIEFGRGYAKSPVIIVDCETFKLMKKEKFKGFSGNKIEI